MSIPQGRVFILTSSRKRPMNVCTEVKIYEDMEF